MNRRGLLGAFAGLLVAPAVVRAEGIMPVRVWRVPEPNLLVSRVSDEAFWEAYIRQCYRAQWEMVRRVYGSDGAWLRVTDEPRRFAAHDLRIPA